MNDPERYSVMGRIDAESIAERLIEGGSVAVPAQVLPVIIEAVAREDRHLYGLRVERLSGTRFAGDMAYQFVEVSRL